MERSPLAWRNHCRQPIGIFVLRLRVSQLKLLGYPRTLRLTYQEVVSADMPIIGYATTASLLASSLVLLVAFPLWMRYREHKGQPTLVPDPLWKNLPYASICALAALSYGAMNSMGSLPACSKHHIREMQMEAAHQFLVFKKPRIIPRTLRLYTFFPISLSTCASI